MQGFHLYVTWILNIQRGPHHRLVQRVKFIPSTPRLDTTFLLHTLSRFAQFTQTFQDESSLAYKTSPKHLKKVIYLRLHKFTSCGPVFATVPRNSPTAAASGRVRLPRLPLVLKTRCPLPPPKCHTIMCGPRFGRPRWLGVVEIARLRAGAHKCVCACVCLCKCTLCEQRSHLIYPPWC